MDVTLTNKKIAEIEGKSTIPLKHEFDLKKHNEAVTEFQAASSFIKNSCRNAESKYLFCNFLSSDPSTWLTPENAENLLSSSAAELKDAQKALQEEEKAVESQIEETVENYQKLQNYLYTLKEKVEILENKKQQLEDLKKKKSEYFAKLGVTEQGIEDIESQKQSKRMTLDDIESKRRKCAEMKKMLQNKITNLERELSKTKEVARHIQENKEMKTKTAEKELQKYQLEFKEMEDFVDKMSFLTNMKVVHMTEDRVKIQLCTNEQKEDMPRLFVELAMTRDLLGYPRLHSSTLSDERLQTEETVQYAINNNDIPLLLTHLQSLWKDHLPMITELQTISHKHALDWLPNENKVRILCGKGGKIVTTLQLPNSYPYSGVISLVSITGLPDSIKQEEIQLPGDKEGLKGWIEYLEDTFGKP